MRQRGFEWINAYKDQGLSLPSRATYQAAGYDLRAAEKVIIPSFWQYAVGHALREAGQEAAAFNGLAPDVVTPTLVPTGLKAYMLEDEYLQITCRSSNPLKRHLVLPNGVGVVDHDYYNNPGNEGHIFVQLLNFGPKDVMIEAGERVAQGIFMKYYTVDDEDQTAAKNRQGGFGSSGRA